MSVPPADLRLAFRTLRRSPIFTLSAVLTLALSIGATTAIFTVVDGLLLAALPYPQADRVVEVEAIDLEAPEVRSAFSITSFWEYRRRSQSFAALAAFKWSFFALTGDGPAERLAGERVSGDYFAVMGVGAALGRTLNAGDDRPGVERVVVLNHHLWQSRFGADPDIVGRRLTLDGERHTVVGVMPDRFGTGQELFVPFAIDFEAKPEGGRAFLFARGRLKDGVSVEQAGAEMRALALQIAAAYPDRLSERDSVRVSSLRDVRVRGVRPALLILQGAVAGLLLIACANVAALALARASRRRRDLAIRGALGAGRYHQVRPMLVEGGLVVATGCLGGVVLAAIGTPILLAMSGFAPGAGSDVRIGLDTQVLLFAAGLSVVSWVLCMVPALHAAPSRLSTALKERAGSPSGGQVHAALVAAEVTLALALLVGAGLLVHSLAGLLAVDPGFDARERFFVAVDLPEARYPDEATAAAFIHRLREEAAALPGVEQAATGFPVPLFGEIRGYFLTEAAFNEAADDSWSEAHLRSISPHFFTTLGIPVRRGRALDERDVAGAAGAVVVNETAAERFWPGQEAVGARLSFSSPADVEPPRWWTVVGVVGDVRHRHINQAAEPELYRSIDQWTLPRSILILRASGTANTVSAALRERMQAVDPGLPFSTLRSFDSLRDGSIAQPRFYSTLLGLFAGLALLLAALSVYGLLASSMDQRRREIAVRAALGASPPAILRFALRRGLAPVVVGLGAGLLAASAASRLLAGLLFEVRPSDPATFIAAVLTLFTVAVVAAGWPAWRATRVDPVAVLKEE